MPSTYTAIKDLPTVLQNALASVGYHRADISIEGRETVSIADMGGDGRRAFAVLVSLTENTYKTVYGSWGGPNPFNQSNPVDLDEREHVIPPGGAVIRGSEGGGHPVLANLYLHPDNLVKYLPPKPELTDAERDCLRQLATLKPSYRNRPLPAVLTSLLSKGLVKQNKAGALQITTAGKSAWR
jgi:hypothetical protein